MKRGGLTCRLQLDKLGLSGQVLEAKGEGLIAVDVGATTSAPNEVYLNLRSINTVPEFYDYELNGMLNDGINLTIRFLGIVKLRQDRKQQSNLKSSARGDVWLLSTLLKGLAFCSVTAVFVNPHFIDFFPFIVR